MGFVRDLVKNGLSSALNQYFERDRHSGEDVSRQVAAERQKVLKSGPVITNRGIFHLTKQQSVQGEKGWKIETLPACPSPTAKFDEGSCHVYRTVEEAQDARCKPCPICYENYPKNLIGLL